LVVSGLTDRQVHNDLLPSLYAAFAMGFAADPLAESGAAPADAGREIFDAKRDSDRPGKYAKRGAHRRRPARGRRSGAPSPPLGPLRRTVREIGFALITAGVVVLLFVGYQLWGTGLAERASQDKLKKQFSAQLANPTTPPSTTPANEAHPSVVPPVGDAIAHLVIPKIGVDKYIVDGVTTSQLRKGPGHYPDTALPGQAGNAAIAGHRTTYGAPFYRLNELQPGDQIVVTTKGGQFNYAVSEARVVKPSDVSVLNPTPDNRLTLTTCTPRFSASSRLVVISRMTGAPSPAVPVTAPPAAVTRPTNLGSGDGGAWPHVLFYGAITIALWVAVRLQGTRVRHRQWLIVATGAVICLLPLWFVFENVVRLLPPNL
jgi:sortase A